MISFGILMATIIMAAK
ncbi:hypothetical protein [Veillonella sp.]